MHVYIVLNVIIAVESCNYSDSGAFICDLCFFSWSFKIFISGLLMYFKMHNTIFSEPFQSGKFWEIFILHSSSGGTYSWMLDFLKCASKLIIYLFSYFLFLTLLLFKKILLFSKYTLGVYNYIFFNLFFFVCIILKRWGSYYVAQADPEFLGSSNPLPQPLE